MRKRSMAFMMSLLIVLCTTPFVNANTGTEFDDSKSDVSCEWIQDDELLVKDGTDLSRIKIDENMVTVTNLKTETEEYFYISEGKVEYSCAVKPPFRDAGYRRSRDGVPQIV